jgi:type IV pilus assembly protein PilN
MRSGDAEVRAVTIMINLLPHREERRKRKKIAFFAGLGVAAFIGAAVVGVWYLVVQQLISGQQERNKFLSVEIAKLDVQIKDIASLKAEIASLKARQKAVEDLQIDRNVPVHVLNELVKQVPEGIYITAVKQEGQLLNVAGIAQTQERVSELLRNTAYNSEWLVKPELIESKAATIQAANKEQKRLFDFSVRLTIKRPQDAPASQAAGVAAAIPAAASAPASAAVVAKKA